MYISYCKAHFIIHPCYSISRAGMDYIKPERIHNVHLYTEAQQIKESALRPGVRQIKRCPKCAWGHVHLLYENRLIQSYIVIWKFDLLHL